MFELLLMNNSSVSAPVAADTGLNFPGFANGAQSTTSELYKLATDTTVVGATLLFTDTNPVASSSKDISIVAAYSSNAPKTTRYVFSTTAVVAGTNLGVSKNFPNAVGNTIAARFAGGYTNNAVNTTERYQYSNDTRTAGATLTVARYACMGFSLDAYGLVHGGYNTSGTMVRNVDKYDFSAETSASSTQYAIARTTYGCFNNTVSGITCGGNVNGSRVASAENCVLSTVTWSTGTALSGARNNGASFGNAQVGIVAGGQDNASRLVTSEKYVFNNFTRVMGGNLITDRTANTGLSSAPGGLA